MHYSDYTLDLETFGTTATSVIVSIGACAFQRSWEVFDADLTAAFYVNVDAQDCLNHGLTIDASTLEWWMKQSNAARLALYEPRPLPLKRAIDELSAWVAAIGGREVPCWTHATFDAPIVGNACKAVGRNLHNITSYKKQRDIRTLNDLGGYYEVDRKGEHHNAVDDAVFQAEYIWGLLNNKGVRE